MSDLALHARELGKMYKIFPSRTSNLLDALGVRGSKRRYKEFWALRGVEIQLAKGKRLGIVGRNGAGKSTFLKLITGNISPTEGDLVVNGDVQALIEAGAGFHPEFTGEENIRASLTLQGAPPRAMGDLIEEIADFTELGDFLSQPFRTYSAGMQARLAFATATAIKPEILIVDEMLSAGDAYFSVKAGERMRNLVDSGASLLLVSHSLDHITMFCEEAIWLDRGRIVERGSSLEIVKSYQQFTRFLDERRIQARNRKAMTGKYATHELENYSDQIIIRVTPLEADVSVDIDEVSLYRGGALEDRVRVGDAQDANDTLDAYLLLDGWSEPVSTERGLARSISSGPSASESGLVVFNVYSIFDDAEYEAEVTFRGGGARGIRVELLHDGTAKVTGDLPGASTWRAERIVVGGENLVARHLGAEIVGPRRPILPDSFVNGGAKQTSREVRRWPGEGRISIEGIRILDGSGHERTVFENGSTLSIETTLLAHEDGSFPLVLGLSVYRLDGLLVTNHAGPLQTLRMTADDKATVTLTLRDLNLGNGRYTFSVAAFRELDPRTEAKVYDLLDRSFEFEVYGNGAFENGVFTHPASWSFSGHLLKA
jgi:lipopolysaccharide transport system ATP-binding protein